MRRTNREPRRERDPLAYFAIMDLGERARDGRFAVRIHDVDWHSKHRGLLEVLLASLRQNGDGDAD
jgi:hypothetical protein